MDTTILNNLELQVETIVRSHSQLQAENITLRKKLAKLIQERATLINKKKNVANQIKRIITELKEEAL